MKIYAEKSLRDFRPWSGAVRTYERIYNAGLIDCLEEFLEEEYPDGMDETQLNDLLWFEPDYILACCGLRSEDEIRDELSDARQRLQDLTHDYLVETEEMESEDEGYSTDELCAMWQELYDDYYRDEIEDLRSTIADLERELYGF